jgi:hypothetical protein
MPVDVVVDKQSDLVRATINSPTDTDEFLASFERMLNHPDFHPGMKILVDMVNYVHQATSDDMRRIARVFVQNTSAVSGMEVAIVVSQPVSYGMIRMLQAFIEGSPFRLHVFYDVEEAKRQLRIG